MAGPRCEVRIGSEVLRERYAAPDRKSTATRPRNGHVQTGCRSVTGFPVLFVIAENIAGQMPNLYIVKPRKGYPPERIARIIPELYIPDALQTVSGVTITRLPELLPAKQPERSRDVKEGKEK